MGLGMPPRTFSPYCRRLFSKNEADFSCEGRSVAEAEFHASFTSSDCGGSMIRFNGGKAQRPATVHVLVSLDQGFGHVGRIAPSRRERGLAVFRRSDVR